MQNRSCLSLLQWPLIPFPAFILMETCSFYWILVKFNSKVTSSTVTCSPAHTVLDKEVSMSFIARRSGVNQPLATLLASGPFTGESGHHWLKALRPWLFWNQEGLSCFLCAIGHLVSAYFSYFSPQNYQCPSPLGLLSTLFSWMKRTYFISRITHRPSLKTFKVCPSLQKFLDSMPLLHFYFQNVVRMSCLVTKSWPTRAEIGPYVPHGPWQASFPQN